MAARIDSSGQMIDDIAYDVLAGGVQITAPEARFGWNIMCRMRQLILSGVIRMSYRPV